MVFRRRIPGRLGDAVAICFFIAALSALAHILPAAPFFLETPVLALALVTWLLRKFHAARIFTSAAAIWVAMGSVGPSGKPYLAGVLAYAASFWTAQDAQAVPATDASPRVLAPAKRRMLLGAAAILLTLFALATISSVGHFMSAKGRREALLKFSRSPAAGGQTPLADRLKAHVQNLAGDIGERDVYQNNASEAARRYIKERFEAAGYPASFLEYKSKDLYGVKDGTAFYNVEAVLAPKRPGAPVWIVGAHYDTAPGTPGADDNGSGVAVLLETAALLKGKRLEKEICFVAFGTEEPPAFGTKNMGSYHYAQGIAARKLPVRGMISLEMLGYYSSEEGSQAYPYIMKWFYPKKGDFIAFVTNFSGWRLLKACKKVWKSPVPMASAVLPGMLADIALSDQLNFWDLGYPALMVSDTAFFRNPHYHASTDKPETLDYEKMAELTASLADMLEKAE